jgi:hypothetical protein
MWFLGADHKGAEAQKLKGNNHKMHKGHKPRQSHPAQTIQIL